MLIEFGHYCLIFAFILCFAPVLGRIQALKFSGPSILSITYWVTSIQFISLAVALLTLMHGFSTSDFSIQSVAFHSNINTPWVYKIAATWGHHEGSMLLWCFFLSGYMVAFMRSKSLSQEVKKYGLFLLNTLLLMFLFYTLFASNPFLRLIPFPINSGELNPLLQDPGMTIHPPLLFLGYIGFAIPFVLSLLALLKPGILPPSALKPWIYTAWGFLTLGITIGSLWAYYELGWGGWWFWDPVENASLLPWLCGTILLHSNFLAQKSSTFYRFHHLVSIITFLLCIFGVLLIRSGILTSVHTFSVDETRGIFLALIFIILLIFSVIVWFKSPKIPYKGTTFSWQSKTSSFVFQNLVFVYLTFILLFAMVFPILQSYVANNPISVSPTFYIQTMGYPFLVAAVAMIFSFDFHKRLINRRTIGYTLLLGLFFGLFTFVNPKPFPEIWINTLGISIALVLILSTTIHLFLPKEPINKKAALAHLCIGIILLGATGNSLWMRDKLAVMSIGDSLDIQGKTITFESITPLPHTNYLAYQAQFRFQNNKVIKPERRLYYTPKTEHSESALYWQGLSLYYVILGETTDQKNWMVRVYYTPLVSLIWLGGLLLSLSILWYAFKKRRRIL
tara:strand:+ start:7353 stop:9212 length:1860 start_codon:yes stop_codon:yes gene_type:complete